MEQFSKLFESVSLMWDVEEVFIPPTHGLVESNIYGNLGNFFEFEVAAKNKRALHGYPY
ncbi:hypothetical protein N790_09995 [Arenimonas malthae CC-JY-1]|uniref:Uncharacterized protein n=1 Tax=Arenimonas malthae CC-JY-1 TaxID=1384054 RepID=A0A091B1E7_9GAMM|nr:hypothetical protein N790_09995 [Arenimonas malthae CC-JY-1]